MQWIIDNQTLLLSITSISTCLGFSAAAILHFKSRQMEQMFEQKAQLEKTALEQEIERLRHDLQDAKQELDELDDERDKSAFELKQAHGKVMAAMEKLRYFEAVKQERQQYATDLEYVKQQRAQSEAELREQLATYQQQQRSDQEKLELLQQSELRLKEQF